MNKKEGDIVKLKILRDNEMINVPVNLEIIQRPLNEQDEIPPFKLILKILMMIKEI